MFTAQQKKKSFCAWQSPLKLPPALLLASGSLSPQRLAPILWRQSNKKVDLKPRFFEGGLPKLSAKPSAKKTWFFWLSASAFCFSFLGGLRHVVPDCKTSDCAILLRFLNCLSFSFRCLVSSSAQVRSPYYATRGQSPRVPYRLAQKLAIDCPRRALRL